MNRVRISELEELRPQKALTPSPAVAHAEADKETRSETTPTDCVDAVPLVVPSEPALSPIVAEDVWTTPLKFWTGCGGIVLDGMRAEDLAHYTNAMNRRMYRTPVLQQDLSELFASYTAETECAVVIPLFLANHKLFAEMLTKHACWIVWDLLSQTDAPLQGISIFLAISENLMPFAEKYLDACHFPRSQVIQFPILPKIVEDIRPVNPHKIEALFSPELDAFKRVISMDADLRILPRPDSFRNPLFVDILGRWYQEPMLLLDQPRFYETPESTRFWPDPRRYREIWEGLVAREPSPMQAVLDAVGMTQEEWFAYWQTKAAYNVSGWITGTSQALRCSDAYREWMRAHYWINREEPMLELFFLTHFGRDGMAVHPTWGALSDFFMRLYSVVGCKGSTTERLQTRENFTFIHHS